MDKKVDGAAGDPSRAAPIEEPRNPFEILGRDRKIGKRAQCRPQTFPGTFLAHPGKQLLTDWAEQRSGALVHQSLPFMHVPALCRTEITPPAPEREGPYRRVNENHSRALR
jgi:hypothetical protein